MPNASSSPLHCNAAKLYPSAMCLAKPTYLSQLDKIGTFWPFPYYALIEHMLVICVCTACKTLCLLLLLHHPLSCSHILCSALLSFLYSLLCCSSLLILCSFSLTQLPVLPSCLCPRARYTLHRAAAPRITPGSMFWNTNYSVAKRYHIAWVRRD